MDKVLNINGSVYVISKDGLGWYGVAVVGADKQITPVGDLGSCCELIADIEDMDAAAVADLMGCDYRNMVE